MESIEMKKWLAILFLSTSFIATAQTVSKVWVSDNGNGTYKNPVINADYSDPDAIRVGDDYYMISSSFNHVPGLPILHSKDLVNWTLIGHALQNNRRLNISVRCSMAAVYGRQASVIITMSFISTILTLTLAFI